jgi:alkaline phosphatase D
MTRFSWTDPRDGGGTYWTDGWDGYAPARQRLLDSIAQRGLSNVVVLGGDVHSHYVADLKLDFDDPKSAPIASEYCGSSISSLGLPQARVDAALGLNPHIRYGRSDQRGYMRFALDAQTLQAQVVVVDALDAAGAAQVAARFVTSSTRAGVQPA